MEDIVLIKEFQDKIDEIYKRERLQSLSMSGTYEYKGRQILAWYFDVTGRFPSTDEAYSSFQQMFDDLVFCSDELIYFTAHLFLYRSFIDNPLAHGHEFSGEVVYSNHQNIPGKRLAMFTDVAYQKAYNYWDRIGDLLAMCFPHRLKEFSINFSSILEAIGTLCANNLHYNWLKSFKEGEYANLNKSRKQIVHYITTATTFKYQHLQNLSNRPSLEQYQRERFTSADYFKVHINLALEGFEHAVALIEDYSNSKYSRWL